MTSPPRSARSIAEAALWAELDTCACGGLGIGWEVCRLASLDGEHNAVELRSACAECGRLRALEFVVPALRGEPQRFHFAHPDDGPSSLYEPAEWWGLAQTYGALGDELLGGDESDEPVVGRAVGYLTQAAAAVDEALRFLPDGDSATPVEAFTTPWGRQAAEDHPGLFDRTSLEAERAARWARVSDLLSRQPATPDPDGAASPTIEPRVDHPRARTADEEHAYLQLHPCACGEPDFDPERGVDELDDGSPIGFYRGACVSCGQQREFIFLEPNDMPIPALGEWAPGREPSAMIDPGEWWIVAQALVSELPDGSGDPPYGDRRRALLQSAGALDEIVKFIPDNADSAPESAFVSSRGRYEFQRSPHAFERAALQVRQRYILAQADQPANEP